MWQGNKQNTQMDADLFHEQILAVLDQLNMETNLTYTNGSGFPFYDSLLGMLMKKYHASLSNYVYCMTDDYDATQDIVQKTWIALYHFIQKQPPSWLEHANIPAWLCTVAKHNTINYSKVQQRTLSLDTEKTAFIFEPHVPPFDYPENVAMREDVRLILYEAVNALKKEQRDVIALYFFYDYSLSDIAQARGIKLNTVKSHLRRGQQRLHKMLVARGIMSSDLSFWNKTNESFPKLILRE